MRRLRFLPLLLALLGAAFCFYWGWKRPLPPSGGLWMRVAPLPVPSFRQNDPRWGRDCLGATDDTLGGQGCAVASAAMVLAFYGADTDPQRLNWFLDMHDGYTPEGWLYWERAAEVSPGLAEKAYENRPSYFLIDWNLVHGNPVIVRLHLPGRTTHFVVVMGKDGWDYLITDPGAGNAKGVYPLREIGSKIEALRFYRRLAPAAPSASMGG